ncbi:MAG: flagellar assembly protein FliW [Verrucomicrobiota bacterium]
MNLNLAAEEKQLVSDLYDKTIHFPLGLPGLQGHTRFLLTRDEGEAPFFTLRSLDDMRIGLTVVEPYALVPDYTFDVDDDQLIPISSPSNLDCAILVVVLVDSQNNNRIQVRANLTAPIIINKKVKMGRQVAITNPPSIYNESVGFEF